MHVGVLASGDSWYFSDLERAARGRHQVTALSFDQIGVALSAGGDARFSFAGGEPAELDALLVRTMPPGSLEQVVFRMDVLGRLEAAGCRVLNPPRAIEAAVDKYLASAKLQAAGLPTPPTVVCQTVEDAMRGFEQLGGDIVLKPLFGSQGRGMTRISDEHLALRAFKTLAQLRAVIYMQQFVQHDGYDIRVLVLGERMLGMRRMNPDDWRTNVSRGARTEPLQLREPIVGLARRAAQSVGAPLAGVDILPGRDGAHYVLEVNAVPGWKALARTLDVDIAAMLLDCLQRLTADQVDSSARAGEL